MSKIIDHSTYAPECTCCDDWHTCARCGADKGNLDLWQAYCDRCAELERLEREIGRITVGQAILDRVAERLMAIDKGRAPTVLNLVYNLLVDERMLLESRWRQLHAADAKGER